MVQANQYKGKQAVVRCGRILIIADDNDILINSKETISLSTNNSIHLDANEYTIINSPKVYLGLDSSDETQPVLRGSDMKDVTLQLINGISKLLEAAKQTPGAFPSTFVIGLGYLEGVINSLRSTYGKDLEKTLSKKIFVE